MLLLSAVLLLPRRDLWTASFQPTLHRWQTGTLPPGTRSIWNSGALAPRQLCSTRGF